MKKKTGDLIVHAFDPLAISASSKHTESHAQFHFHTDFQSIPGGLDLICALHPNPMVLYPYRLNDDDIHYSRYLSLLIHLIKENLAVEGKIALQFDIELENI